MYLIPPHPTSAPVAPLPSEPDEDSFEIVEEEREPLWPYPLPRYSLWAPAPAVLELVTHAVYAPVHEDRLPEGPALVLVHEGELYLTGNGLPSLPGDPRDDHPFHEHRVKVVHLRAPRGKVLSGYHDAQRYAGTGNDFVVVWWLTEDDPARIAAVGPDGRVVVHWTETGPVWDAVPAARSRRTGR